MPELPSVERARKEITQYCVNNPIVDFELFTDDIVFTKGSFDPCKRILKKEKIIKKCGRKGKYLWWEMSDKNSILFHFGMTGKFVIKNIKKDQIHYRSTKSKSDGGEVWPPKFSKLVAKFKDGNEVAFVNTRRLGRIFAMENKNVTMEDPVKKLGFDPLLEMPSDDEFEKMALKRKCPLKALLLDQGFSAGVGNWIADEVMYQAKIHPEVRANELSKNQLKKLKFQIENVIKTACDVNGDSSKFPKEWLFHYRWEKGNKQPNNGAAKDHFNNPIKFETVGGRTTAIVLKVQKKRDDNNKEEVGIKKEKEVKQENKGKSGKNVKKEKESVKKEKETVKSNGKGGTRTTRTTRNTKQNTGKKSTTTTKAKTTKATTKTSTRKRGRESTSNNTKENTRTRKRRA